VGLGEVFHYPGPVAIEVPDLCQQMGFGIGLSKQSVRAGLKALDAKPGVRGRVQEDDGDVPEMG